MRRLSAGLVTLVTFGLAGLAQGAGIVYFHQYNTDELFDETVPGFVAGSGFTIRRTFVTLELSTPETAGGPPEVTGVTVTPVELWFLGHSGDPENLELQSLTFDNMGSLIAGKNIKLNELGLQTPVTELNSRLGYIEAVDEGATGGKTAVETIVITSPRSHLVTTINVRPVTGSPEQFFAADYDDLDDTLGGDPLLARAPADFGGALRLTTPLIAHIPAFPVSVDLRSFDLPGQMLGLDAEAQPLPGSGVPVSGTEALVRLLRYPGNPQQIAAAALSTLAPTQLNVAHPLESAAIPGFPAGVTIESVSLPPGATIGVEEIPPSEEEPGGWDILLENIDDPLSFFVTRSGGLLDTVYLAPFDVDGEGGATHLPTETPVALFTNYALSRQYPLRIQEIEFDFDGSLWVRTERVADEGGAQVLPDLYQINFASSEFVAQVDWPAPFNPVGRGDMNGDGRVDAADTVWLTNFLSQGGDPNKDPEVLDRADTDANGAFDPLDREAIATIPLMGPPAGSFFNPRIDPVNFAFRGGLFLSPRNIYDIETVDVNRDGLEDIAALVDGLTGGTRLLVVLSTGAINELGTYSEFVTLPFDARDMAWGDFLPDSYPDVALVNRTPAGVRGTLVLGFNRGPADEQDVINLDFTPFLDAGPSPLDVQIGLADRDNRLDVVIGNDAATDNLTVYYMRYPQGNPEQNTYTVRDAPRGLRLGSGVTRDAGKDDIAIAADTDFVFQFLNQTGVGSLSSSFTGQAGPAPRDVAIGRFTTPGENDPNFRDVALVGATPPGGGINSPDLQIFRSNGDGSFLRVADIAIGFLTDAIDIEAADFNLDGRDDVALIGQRDGLAVYLSNPAFISFTAARTVSPEIGGPWASSFSFTGNLSDLELLDLDHDDDQDLLVSLVGTLDSNAILIFENPVLAPLALKPPGEDSNTLLRLPEEYDPIDHSRDVTDPAQ